MKGKTACFSNPKEDFKCLFKGGRKAKWHNTPGQIQQKARTPETFYIGRSKSTGSGLSEKEVSLEREILQQFHASFLYLLNCVPFFVFYIYFAFAYSPQFLHESCDS